MVSPTLFLDANGQHDAAKYLRWHKKRLRTIRRLHKAGYRELYHFSGWDCVRVMTVLKEFGLLVPRMPIGVYDTYTMLPGPGAAAWIHYDEQFDILFVKPRKRKALQAQMAEWLADSIRGWFDRYHNDYITAEQKALVQSPGYGWPTMREGMAVRERMDTSGYLRLNTWMEQHDLSDMHLELAGVIAPHPTNLYYDQMLSVPTRFGSRFVALLDGAQEHVIKQGRANALLRRVRGFGT